MRKNKNYSVFNNFNRNYNTNPFEPNYYNEYENEFSEDLFDQNYYRGLNDQYQNTERGNQSSTNQSKERNFDSQPRNGK